jgi:hypothetical protein
MLVIHILWVIIWPAYRPLLGSWFTGKTPEARQSQRDKSASLKAEDTKINKLKT